MAMKVYLAADHAGFQLKEKVKGFLKQKNFEVEDCGAFALDNSDDYPDFISKAAKRVSENPASRAIVIGGSGQAEAMLANKFRNVRCALFYSPVAPVHAADVTGRKSTDPFEMIRLTREHNDANILSLGARFLREDDAIKAVDSWLRSPFSNDERHVRRIGKISLLENQAAK
jgi:ribose 5-phosphate isomerase B